MKEAEKKIIPAACSGAATGLINGFFGGGGGMILVPLLVRFCGLNQREAFANSVAIVLPLCVLSASIYYAKGNLDIFSALPYLTGGFVGGLVGGKIFQKFPIPFLKKLFVCLILYGAWSALSG